jgi:hypothetical protein|tara:strand:+ start:181 stop:1029 length:849 start_codon:yes stop_codon:yes gene_type:complete
MSEEVKREIYKSEAQSVSDAEGDVIDSRGTFIKATKVEKTDDQLLDEEVKNVQADKELDETEKSYVKRYADLRRYSAKQLKEAEEKYQNDIYALKEKLEATSDGTPLLTDDETNAFIEENPDAYKVVVSLIRKETAKRDQEVARLKKTITEREKETRRAKAEKVLIKIHPNWEELTGSDEFHTWLSKKSKKTQESVYDNEDNGLLVAEVIDFYLSDTGSSVTKKNINKKAASTLVKTGSPTTMKDEERTFTRSQIQKMTMREYEELELEIKKAQAEGRILNK